MKTKYTVVNTYSASSDAQKEKAKAEKLAKSGKK